MGTVLWQGVETGALDRCTMEAGRDGLRLSGIVLTPEHGTPLDVRYLVETGPDGLTRRVELALDGGATRRVLLADGAGSWRWEGGDGLPEVDGTLDVDLTVTPATNTLPIRRLARQLETGQAADLRMAWVQFPGLEVLASAQRYQRLAPDRWHFSTGDFHAELLVDPDGLVLDYGGLFRSLAYRRD